MIRTKTSCSLIFTLSLICSLSVFAQVPEPIVPPSTPQTPATSGDLNNISPQAIEALKAKAMVIDITARINSGKDTVWSADQKRVTVHGLSVSVRLERPNLLILAEITPYRVGNTVLLVVKSELWSRGPNARTVQYFAGLKSANVEWDESIFFYPLGAASRDQESQISLEITVNHFQDSRK